jgi:hypothetical protein
MGLCVNRRGAATYGGSGLSYRVRACPLVPCNGRRAYENAMVEELDLFKALKSCG